MDFLLAHFCMGKVQSGGLLPEKCDVIFMDLTQPRANQAWFSSHLGLDLHSVTLFSSQKIW